MSTENQKSNTETPSSQGGVIRWLGECIFPQPFHELDAMFDFEDIYPLAEKGLIRQGQISVGLSPTSMKNPKGKFIELTEKGWEEYERLRAI